MAAFPILGGGAVLDVASKTITLPMFGEVTMSSAVVFDIGVYMTVVGVVLMAFEAFGDEHDGGARMTVLLAATAATLFGVGTYLILQRKLSRIIIGIGLMTHGANVLLITSGRRGDAPIIGTSDSLSDPMPQALALTAIVITFAVTTLLLALAYRSWLLTHDDEVEDDLGDRSVARGAVLHEDADDPSLTESVESGDSAP